MRLLLLLLAFACSSAEPKSAGPGGPVPVRVVEVAPSPLERNIEATGVVEAVDSAEIRPEISGLVEVVLFEDGAVVRKGQPLVRLRAVDARAALLDARSRATLASIQLERQRALQQAGDAAQADLDRADAENGLAQAAVLKAEEALRRTTIVAPFDGVVGRRGVSPGEQVDPTRTITRIEGLERLVVDVALAESALGVVAPGQAAEVRAEAMPGETFAGTVAYVSPRVREDTRTIDVRIALPSPGGLRPGLTTTTRIVTDRAEAALLVPTEAVVQGARGPGLYVVGADGSAELRPVRLGERQGAAVEVVEGLAAGDSVVVEGLTRLRPGAKVEVRGAAPEAP